MLNRKISKLILVMLLLTMVLTGCEKKKDVTLTIKELDKITFNFDSNKTYDFYMVNDSDDLEITKASVKVELIDKEEPAVVDYRYKLAKDETVAPHSEEMLDIWLDTGEMKNFDEYNLQDRSYTVVKDGCTFFVRINLKDEVTITKKEE